ncbi:MAG: cardiolipin synthase [Clostridia bacterium]
MKKRRFNPVSIPFRIIGIIFKIIFAFIVIALQIAWIFFAVYYYKNIPFLSILSQVFSVIVACYIYYTNQNVSYKILWIILIMVFPLAGTTIYLLYGYGKSAPKKRQKQADAIYLPAIAQNKTIETITDIGDRKIATLLNSLSKFPCYKGANVRYYTDGEPMYIEMLKDLKSAKKYIFLETFIIAQGKMWEEIEKILFQKADNGVRIYILFDSFGSYKRLKANTVKRFHHHYNIEMVGFNPIGMKITPALNHRDHRKLVIVDGLCAYIGGVNFADEYVHYETRFGFWRDSGARVEGSSIDSFIILFCQNWFIATRMLLNPKEFIVVHQNIDNDAYIFPFGDTPADMRDPAYNCCMSLFENAKKSIWISTPYLIVDDEMISVLCRAANSGIDVRILVPGIPDKKIVYTVTRSHYSRLLKNGVKIYEYLPGFNHSKMILTDEKTALIGSINLDYRSLLLHYELGALLINSLSAVEMATDFLEALDKSFLVTEEIYESRTWLQKLKEFVLNLLAPLM